jgi:hypothetical protein
MDKQVKETLINKVQNSLEKSGDNEKVQIKDFSTILSKKAGNFLILFHPAFKNVNLKFPSYYKFQFQSRKEWIS